MSEDVGLIGVQSICCSKGIPILARPVALDKDTGQGNGIFRVIARSLVRSARRECNMGFVVGGVNILAIPAHRKIDLGADTRGTSDRREAVVCRRFSIKVQAQEGDSLLGITTWVVRSQRHIPRNHSKVVRECLDRVRLTCWRVIEQVVDDVPYGQRGKRPVLVLEIQMRVPITRSVFLNGHGGAFTVPQQGSREVHAEIAPSNHGVSVA